MSIFRLGSAFVMGPVPLLIGNSYAFVKLMYQFLKKGILYIPFHVPYIKYV